MLLHRKYCLGEIQSEKVRWADNVARMGEKGNAESLVGEPEEKSLLGRSGRR